MEATVSPGMLKKAYEWVEKKFLKKHFDFSHNVYLKENYLGKYWSQLYGDIEISWDMATWLSNEVPPTSRIALRSKNNNQIDRLELTIEADGHSCRYQEHIVVHMLTEKPLFITLKNIPVEDLYVVEGVGIVSAYKSLSPKIVSITTNGQKEAIDKELIAWEPMHNNYLNRDFIKKWGKFYNLDVFKEAKLQYRYWLAYSVCKDDNEALMLMNSHVNRPTYMRVKHFFLGGLLSEKFINFSFWALIVCNVLKPSENGSINFRIKRHQ